MDIQEATKLYEQWLGSHLELVESDLELKHERMAADVYPFLRATYYRWAQTWREACPQLADAPNILSVGDIHVENFGTWRDAEGRLIWGINDLDEAYTLPWTSDLLRLTTSALLAIDDDHLSLGRGKACSAILNGYKTALTTSGRPFVLAEHHGWLRKISISKLRSPDLFWRKLDELDTWKGLLEPGAMAAVAALLPKPDLPTRLVHRVAGLGSLGRHRWVAIADWQGGRVAREAKALAPSASIWAESRAETNVTYCQQLLDNAVRVDDPYLKVVKDWIVRRLSPDCIRVELASLPAHQLESQLLEAMGFELGNVHLATPGMKTSVVDDIEARPANWLQDAAKVMCKRVIADWKDWRKSRTP